MKMNTIKWNEKCFEESGLYLWIYNNGALVCTNNRFRKKINLKNFKIYSHKKSDKASIKSKSAAKNNS